MNKLMMAIIITSLAFTCFANEGGNNDESFIYQENSRKITSLENEVSVLKNSQINLNEQIDFSKRVIDRQNLIMDRYISLLGILLAIIGIFIPITSYYFVIKPIQNNKKWFNKNYKKLEKKFFIEELTEAITEVFHSDQSVRNRGYTYIYSNRYRIASDIKLKSLIFKLKSSKYENIRDLYGIIEKNL